MSYWRASISALALAITACVATQSPTNPVDEPQESVFEQQIGTDPICPEGESIIRGADVGLCGECLTTAPRGAGQPVSTWAACSGSPDNKKPISSVCSKCTIDL